MGLIRILTIAFLIWLAIYFVKRLINSSSQIRRPHKPREIENMVACHKCGLHVPQEEAIESKGRYYCSESHRDADRS